MRGHLRWLIDLFRMLVALAVPSGRQPPSTSIHGEISDLTPVSLPPALTAGTTAPMSRIFVVGPSGPPIIVEPHEMTLIGPAERTVVTVIPQTPERIVPPKRPLWEDRLWVRTTFHGRPAIEGDYRFFDAKAKRERGIRGRIVFGGKTLQVYVLETPPELRRHPGHGGCFWPDRDGHANDPAVSIVNWVVKPRVPDEAIAHIERLLVESFAR